MRDFLEPLAKALDAGEENSDAHGRASLYFGKFNIDAAVNGSNKAGNGFTLGAGWSVISDFFGGGIGEKSIRTALTALPQSSWAKHRLALMQPVWDAIAHVMR